MSESLIDPFGRKVSYIRVSVTDRCDLRCTYCMAEDMVFLPKARVLTLEELERLCRAFIRLGTRKIRLTGGEPLVRRGILTLIERLGAEVGAGLDELTLTTNGTQLTRFARDLAAAGIRRINVSLDTLVPDRFTALTRLGELRPVLDGIEAAREVGLAVKINTVALRGINEDEFEDLLRFCGRLGLDMTLIETMPLGDVGEQRTDHYLPLSVVRQRLERSFTLTDIDHSTGGPSRYVSVAETGRRLGFITPMSNHFCDGCNRVRLTCTGTLFLCLGQDDRAELREVLRENPDDDALDDAIRAAIARKPKGHDFKIEPGLGPAVTRHMNMTGG